MTSTGYNSENELKKTNISKISIDDKMSTFPYITEQNENDLNNIIKMSIRKNLEKDVDKKEKVRNSSIELLRILAQINVIIHHYCGHTRWQYRTGINNVGINQHYIKILETYGDLTNLLYMLITGYFTVKSKFNYKRFILLIFEYEFYCYLLFLSIQKYFSHKYNISGYNNSYFNHLPILYYKYHFFASYIVFYIFTPFLNKLLAKLDKKTFLSFVLVVFSTYIFVPSVFRGKQKVIVIGNTFTVFFIYYVMGAYIRIHGIRRKNILKAVGISSLIYSIYKVNESQNLLNKTGNRSYLHVNRTYYYPYNSISIFFSSIGIFLIFEDLKIKSKIINFIAPSTFAIYLLHCYPDILQMIMNDIYDNRLYFDNGFFKHLFYKTMAIFFGGLGIDLIRRYTIELLLKCILNKGDKYIQKFIDKISSYFFQIIGLVI